MISSIVSWVWTIMAITGVVVNLHSVSDAKIDRYYAQTHIHKGTRSLVANANIRRERVRLAIQGFFVAAGILSIVNPPSVPMEGTRAFIGAVMVIASLLTVFNSIADRHDRKRLLALIDEQDERRLHSDTKRDKADKTLREANEDFQDRTEGALRRLEKAGDRAATAAEKVAVELSSSQDRADAVEGHPGEAADAASKSDTNNREE